MDTDRARELFPWLLNGSLEEPERSELLAALRGDGELRRELAETRQAGEIFGQHVPAGELVAHAFGAPTALAGERIEAHLALCERCAEEIALVRESRSLADEPDSAERREPGVLPFRRPAAAPAGTGRTRRFAVAASLAAMVGFGGWLATWQSSQGRIADLAASLGESLPPAHAREVPDDRSLGLKPLDEVVRGSGHASLAPGGAADVHELYVYLEEPATAVWELRLIDPAAEGGERELVRTRPAPVMPGDGNLVFRVAALPAGEYVAELRRLDPRRGWVLVERYAVPVGSAG